MRQTTNKFRYARYMPMLNYEAKIDQLEAQSQRNMERFMKNLLENNDVEKIQRLTEEEIKIVAMYLDYAERQARQRKTVNMVTRSAAPISSRMMFVVR